MSVYQELLSGEKQVKVRDQCVQFVVVNINHTRFSYVHYKVHGS